jgi:pimeloyl-ACP methyl ester carboxylesterase
VRAFCDEVGIDRAIWTGNSLGGLIAIHGAAAWPDRVAGLIGVDAALPSEGGRPDARIVTSFIAPAMPILGDFIYRQYIRRPPSTLVRESLERNFVRPDRISETTLRAVEVVAGGRVGGP